MKKRTYYLFIFGIILSCNKSNVDIQNIKLVGKWKLIEVLQDPGDSSGVFIAVNSSKTVTLNDNGTIFSNGSLCKLSTDSNLSSSGTYSATAMTINPSECGSSNLRITFEIFESKNLIITYNCFEPCLEKYVKIE